MRVLCLPYTHTLSHLSRPLAVAKELRQRGHEILFAGNSPKDRFIREEGFEILPLDQLDPEILFSRIRQGKLQFVKDDELSKMVEDDLVLFRSVNPDLVLSDGRFSAPISTGIKELAHAAIVNVSSTEYRALPYIPFFNWIPEKIVNRGSAFWKFLDRLNLRLEMEVFDQASSIFKKMSKEKGLPHKVTATNCLAGKDLTLLADIEEYFPTRNLPSNYHYIGPLTWESHLPPPSWWPPQKKGDFIAYITMGTTWMDGSFASLCEMFKKHRISAIISTGGQLGREDADNLRNSAEGIYIEDFIRGDLAMKASDLVVCHGGNGTIYQALQNGIPIVGIPTIPDQAFNMRRVESLEVGRTISLKEFKNCPGKLFDAMSEIHRNEKYRKNAEKLEKKLSRTHPAAKAADLIEKNFTDS